MPSKRFPALFVALAGVSLVTWTLSAWYSVRVNPEVQFWKQAAERKLEWAKRLDSKSSRKTIIFGGSSCTFAIDPVSLLKLKEIPCVNMGLHAGMGQKMLISFALLAVNEGDTLVMALEPGLLRKPGLEPALARQFALGLNRPELQWDIGNETAPRFPWLTYASSLRPGSYHAVTLTGKLLAGQPLYRYSPGDLRPGGWLVARERRVLSGSEPEKESVALSLESRATLQALAGWCRARNVRLLFLLPWQYVPERFAEQTRRANLDFLRQIVEFMPVLADEKLGVLTDASAFADTGYHLVPQAAHRRTEEFANLLLDPSAVWTSDTLPKLQSEPRSVPPSPIRAGSIERSHSKHSSIAP